MIESKPNLNSSSDRKSKKSRKKTYLNQFQNLASMCKVATNIIDQLYNPIDSTNRFINLALQSLEENSQSRQFLVDSKQGIRKASTLLKELNSYTKQIEKEMHQMSQAR